MPSSNIIGMDSMPLSNTIGMDYMHLSNIIAMDNIPSSIEMSLIWINLVNTVTLLNS